MKFNRNLWVSLSLLNLLIVAFLGLIMRYKIGFEFPWLNQKYLQHAHSHFAFQGWVTQTLYVLLTGFLANRNQNLDLKAYRRLLVANLICSYGMLFSFTISGYSVPSIVFSTGTILIAVLFALRFLGDLKNLNASNVDGNWFRAALWFNVLSSVGTIYLAYMMGSRKFDEHWYLASVYFYLHFQYNGFFLFACLGIGLNELRNRLPDTVYDPKIFQLFFWSAIPAYFLSTLWAHLPFWLYAIVVVAALVQVWAGWRLFVYLRPVFSKFQGSNLLTVSLFCVAGIALGAKLLLQLGSTVPLVSKLAFGFRPIVIAYLHLVLLALISVFLLAYFYATKLYEDSRLGRSSLLLFVIGVILNEVVLGIQGVASFSYFPIAHINGILFGVAVLLFVAALLMWLSQTLFRSSALKK